MATAPTAPTATGTQPESVVMATNRTARRVRVFDIVVSFARQLGRAFCSRQETFVIPLGLMGAGCRDSTGVNRWERAVGFWRIGGLVALGVMLGSGAVDARERLGWSLAISNDSIGEFLDRWQSSSVQVGAFYGPAWSGAAPERFGEMLELRFRTDILTPADLEMPDPSDRRHAGVLAFGVHSYASPGAFEVRGGVDLVVVGPQTGLLDLQQDLHKVIGFPVPTLDDFQIEDTARLDFSGEVARVWEVGSARVRPFLEAQVGSEDMLRAGFDVTFGALGRGDQMVRSVTTGHRVPVGLGRDGGFSFVLGADVARVVDSIYLPESLGYELTSLRKRVRAGVHYRADPWDVFYGIAWLGEEFEAQPEGQLVGTFQIAWPF